MTDETNISRAIRIEGARHGLYLWRNNVGVAFDRHGVPVRFGLANDSSQVNERLKSSDLIGIYGNGGGRFVAIEVKSEGWVYHGTPRELAQCNFLNLIIGNGGIAGFARSWADVVLIFLQHSIRLGDHAL